jgi:hypothetical protein
MKKQLVLGAGGLKLCSGDRAIEIDGKTLRPDRATALVEFYLSHAFPVTTCDGTGLHPQVVANSYESMLYKVFDLNHLMKKYDPGIKQDQILGTVIAVEFGARSAECGFRDEKWEVQPDKAKAPGIRAVACMHRNAEWVDRVLEKHFTGAIDWTVSMEQDYSLDNSGFVVRSAERGVRSGELKEWEEKTPGDLKALGWTYVPAGEAPDELFACFDQEKSKITRKFKGSETVMLFGGLDGRVEYCGVGLTPAGKEKEAMVARMMAGRKYIEVNGELVADFRDLLAATAVLPREV